MPTRPKHHRSTDTALPPLPQPFPTTQDSALSEADIDRFATLFSPATPPATPTAIEQPLLANLGAQDAPVVRPRKSTQGSSDSDFGAFVSVPPSQDPLSPDPPPGAFRSNSTSVGPSFYAATPAQLSSLGYFDLFTTNAKAASERSRREVLDELLQHQDDPMYFISNIPSVPSTSPSAVSIPTAPTPQSTDEALAEALTSEMTNPHTKLSLVRANRGGSIKVAPGPSRAHLPLPPRLSSGSASPPSISSPDLKSNVSLPVSSSPPPLFASGPTQSSAPTSTSPFASASVSTLGTKSSSPPPPSSSPRPAHDTLSRLSSSLVSLLPSGRPRTGATPQPSTFSLSPSSAPGSLSRFSAPSSLTHGSPFAATPYIPPTGAPGFAGDHAWDRGFSDVLEEEEKRGLIDPVGLGIDGHHHGHQHQRQIQGGSKIKGVTLLGRREGTERILEEYIADMIRPHLPALTKLPRRWTLLYSLDQHGISLNTLYARCEPRVPTRAHPGGVPQGGLLVVRDAHDAVFGVWISEGIKLEKGGYYGSGDAFLWTYRVPMDAERQGRVDVYGWTGTNAYVALCEPGFISFGGGDGHYGLYLDASLLEGSTAACPTFGNPPLCARSEGRHPRSDGAIKVRDVPFECVGLEVWGVGPG